MAEEQTGKLRLSAIKDMLCSPLRTIEAVRQDRYKSLKVRIFFTVGTLAGVPLLIVTAVCFFWLHAVLIDDLSNHLRWQMEHAREGLEFFLKDRIATLRYIASAHPYFSFTNPASLRSLFQKRKQEFPELIDLEVINAEGRRIAYAGPYVDSKDNYADQEWFVRAKIYGAAVSQVFPGERDLLHYTIAIRQDMPDGGGFWILKSSIDIGTLTRFVSEIGLTDRDDAFLVAGGDILQTNSRFHGAAFQRLIMPAVPSQKGFLLMQFKDPISGTVMLGATRVEGSPWTLVAFMKPTTVERIVTMLKREILAVYLIIVFVGIGAWMNYRTTNSIVNRIRDTDRAREEALTHSEHSAKLASIGRLAAGVAHEINNPLAIINEKAGLIQDLFEMYPESSGCQRELLPLVHSISENVNRCRTITQRLLGFARRMDINIEPINVNDVIRDVVGFLERELSVRNIHLELNLDEAIPQIQSDRGLLQQVFLNIANNALDAVQDGGEIVIASMSNNGDGLKVVIRDKGAGIPKEVLKHIFEPFYTTKKQGKGTGLGLSLSYGIIQRLGGTIEVDSFVDKGTIFTITLPLTAHIGRSTL